MTNPNDALQQILNSGTTGDGKTTKANVVINSPKIANAALREFVYLYRYTNKLSDHDILELIIAMDELVENKELDSEKLAEIQKDPNIFKDN
jgi:broad-specificity NMP kinase